MEKLSFEVDLYEEVYERYCTGELTPAEFQTEVKVASVINLATFLDERDKDGTHND